MSTKNLTNIHTKEHKKDPITGRSPEIEGYITLSCSHVINKFREYNFDLDKITFIDIGCDYGYALYYMTDFIDGDKIGFEPNNDFNPFDVEIYKDFYSLSKMKAIVHETLESYAKEEEKYDIENYVFFMNHSFEHVENPTNLLKEINKTMEYLNTRHRETIDPETPCETPRFFLFVAVPKLGTEWAYWDGHVTLWDEKHLSNILNSNLKMYNTKIETHCFREDNTEIWLFAEIAHRAD